MIKKQFTRSKEGPNEEISLQNFSSEGSLPSSFLPNNIRWCPRPRDVKHETIVQSFEGFARIVRPREQFKNSDDSHHWLLHVPSNSSYVPNAANTETDDWLQGISWRITRPLQSELFTYHLEHHLLNNPGIKLYGKLLDDITGIFIGDPEELQHFLNTANTIDEGTKIVWDKPSQELLFMDITVAISDGAVTFDLFPKAYNLLLSLPVHSWNSKHTLRGSEVSAVLRIKGICTRIEYRHRILMLPLYKLAERRYSHTWISLRLKQALKPRKRIPHDCNKVPFALPDTQRIRGMKLGDILNSNASVPYKPILAHQRPKNLLQLLSSHQPTHPSPPSPAHPPHHSHSQVRNVKRAWLLH